MDHSILLLLAGLLVLGMFCQWLAWRLKIPAILPLLASGFILGPVLHILQPRELMGDLFFPTVSLLVAVILFEGALTLNFKEIRTVADVVRNLVTIGAAITWVSGALAAHYILGMDWLLSVLFGSLIVVTGPTVITPLLRNVRPIQSVSSVLRWEGILIDPLGALLAVLVFDFIVAEGGGAHSVNPLFGFLRIVFTGASLGLTGGFLVEQMLRRYLVPDYLRDIVVLAFVAGVFAVSDTFQSESGLLAVTVMGIFLANRNLHQLREIWHFKEKLSILFISGVFLLLPANIDRSTLLLLDWRAFVLLAAAIFVIRPLAVQASAIGSKLNVKERLFLSWIGPRGIVAAAVTTLFSFRLQELGYGEAALLEPLVFLIIVGTVVIQGGTAKLFAKYLGVAEADPQGFLIVGAHPFARLLGKAIQDQGFVVRMVDSNFDNVRAARLEGLDVYYGNILSEYTEDHIELAGVGRLLALTSNDEANALACRHLQDELGSSEVYQLVPRTMAERSKSRSPSRFTLGRLLFNDQATFNKLHEMTLRGATVKTTQLTQQFGYSDYLEQYEERFIPLMATKGRDVMMSVQSELFEPQAGWTLLSLIMETAIDDMKDQPEIEEMEQTNVEPAAALPS